MVWLPPPPVQHSAPIEPGYVGVLPHEVQLGTCTWHDELPFTLTFVNGRDRPVVIESVRASCECTVLNTDDILHTTIGPEESATIVGSLRVGRRMGVVRSTVSLVTLDGESYDAIVGAYAEPLYMIAPSELQFGTIDTSAPEAPQVQRVRLTIPAGSVVGQPRTDVAWLRAALTRQSAGEYIVVVGVEHHSLDHGDRTGRVLLDTDNPREPVAVVRVYAAGRASFRAVPNLLFLGSDVSRSVRLLDDDGVPVAAQSIDGGTLLRITAFAVTATGVAVAIACECGTLHQTTNCTGCTWITPTCDCATSGPNAGKCVDGSGSNPVIQVQCGAGIWGYTPNSNGVLVCQKDLPSYCTRDRWCQQDVLSNPCTTGSPNNCKWGGWTVINDYEYHVKDPDCPPV